MIRRTFARRLLAGALLALSSACGGDGGTDPGARVSGTYRATTFTGTVFGSTVDILAAGGSLTLTFAPTSGPAGAVTGRVVVPAGVTGGLPIDQAVTGTFTVTGNTVSLTENSGLLNQVTLQASGNTLTGEQDVSGVRIKVTLTKQ